MAGGIDLEAVDAAKWRRTDSQVRTIVESLNSGRFLNALVADYHGTEIPLQEYISLVRNRSAEEAHMLGGPVFDRYVDIPRVLRNQPGAFELTPEHADMLAKNYELLTFSEMPELRDTFYRALGNVAEVAHKVNSYGRAT